MKLEEGQIYEGDVSLSGELGPHRVWIVVAPFGRTHLHSIDDPLDLHCLTLDAAHRSVANGTLQLIDTNPEHPVLALQREKERRGIQDTHLGLSGKSLHTMSQLLHDAVEAGEPYAPYAAGEILAQVNPELCDPTELEGMRGSIASAFAPLSL